MRSISENISDTVRRLEDKNRESDLAQPNFTPLKELEQFCNEYLFHTSDPIERVVMFFLARHLENLFFNLGGDTFYDEELKYVKREIFTQLLEGLKKLPDEIENENSEEILKIFSDIIRSYISQIKFLNRRYVT